MDSQRADEDIAKKKNSTPRHITVKPKNIRDKEKGLTAPREKEQITAEEHPPTLLELDISSIGSMHQGRQTREKCTRNSICKEFKKKISPGGRECAFPEAKQCRAGESPGVGVHQLRPHQSKGDPATQWGSTLERGRLNIWGVPATALGGVGGGSHHCGHVRLLPSSPGGSPPPENIPSLPGMAFQTLLVHLSRKPCAPGEQGWAQACLPQLCVHRTFAEEGWRNVNG